MKTKRKSGSPSKRKKDHVVTYRLTAGPAVATYSQPMPVPLPESVREFKPLRIHIDDWLDSPGQPGEEHARVFLEHCRRPAIDTDYVWLGENPLFCSYEGYRFRVTGASRLGDIWLAQDFKQDTGYNLRVCVSRCGNWGSEP